MKYKVSDLQFYKALQKVEKALEEGHTLNSLEPSISNIRKSTIGDSKRTMALYKLRMKYSAKEFENNDEAMSN